MSSFVPSPITQSFCELEAQGGSCTKISITRSIFELENFRQEIKKNLENFEKKVLENILEF